MELSKMSASILRSKPFRLIYLVYAWIIIAGIWLIGYFFAALTSVGSGRKEHIYNTFCRLGARLTAKGLGIHIVVEGIENIPKGEPVIFICNHQSFFDIYTAFGFIPQNFCFISKEEVFSVPLVGTYMTTAEHIPLAREEDRRSYTSLTKAVRKAREGRSLLVFPEGTRSQDGRLGPFKRGISLIVLKAGRKVVPMCIIGSRNFLPKGEWLPHPANREIRVRFGKPIEFARVSKMTKEESVESVDRLRQAVTDLMEAQGKASND
ncbi:MAG: lysophospholipid acyltransferase family protein [Candidatus Brocadiales bacterium]